MVRSLVVVVGSSMLMYTALDGVLYIFLFTIISLVVIILSMHNNVCILYRAEYLSSLALDLTLCLVSFLFFSSALLSGTYGCMYIYIVTLDSILLFFVDAYMMGIRLWMTLHLCGVGNIPGAVYICVNTVHLLSALLAPA